VWSLINLQVSFDLLHELFDADLLPVSCWCGAVVVDAGSNEMWPRFSLRGS